MYATRRAAVLEIGLRQNCAVQVLATKPYAAAAGTWQRLTIDLNLPGRIAVIAAGTGPGAQVAVTGAQVAVTGLGTATFGNRVGFATISTRAHRSTTSASSTTSPPTRSRRPRPEPRSPRTPPPAGPP